MTTFGERLKLLRGKTSQSQFAARLGIPQMTLSNYETGKSEPKFSLVDLICTTFCVDANWLILGRGSMKLGDEADTAAEVAPQANCPRCAKLEARLEYIEEERREWAAERRDLSNENRRLWKENAELRERCARFEEREKQGATPPMPEKKQIFRSNDHAEIR